MPSTTLTKITARAKQIRKAHPKMAWAAAVKKAGAEYRAKKPAAKKTAKRVAKKATPKKRVSGSPKTTVKGATREAQQLLLNRYGMLAQKKLMETTKRGKAALQKEMSFTARQAKRLRSL